MRIAEFLSKTRRRWGPTGRGVRSHGIRSTSVERSRLGLRRSTAATQCATRWICPLSFSAPKNEACNTTHVFVCPDTELGLLWGKPVNSAYLDINHKSFANGPYLRFGVAGVHKCFHNSEYARKVFGSFQEDGMVTANDPQEEMLLGPHKKPIIGKVGHVVDSLRLQHKQKHEKAAHQSRADGASERAPLWEEMCTNAELLDELAYRPDDERKAYEWPQIQAKRKP